VIAAHRVEDQSLISFKHVADESRVMHGELQAQLVEAHTWAGAFAVKRQ
jgi:hypothetical protein